MKKEVKVKGKYLFARLPEDIHRQLDEYSEKTMKSKTLIIKELIRYYCK